MEKVFFVKEHHQFKSKGKFLVFDVYNSRIFNVDELAYSIMEFADKKTQKSIVDNFLCKYSQDDIESTLAELTQAKLISNEEFVYPDFISPERDKYDISSIDLILSQDCNMRCIYCFADTGAFKGERGLMTSEVAKKALDFVFERSNKSKNIHIGFFGGEPLLNIPVLKECVEYGYQKAQSLDKTITYSISTNGTLLKKELIEYLNEKQVKVQFSIDGNEEVQNANRPLAGNHASYKIVTERLKDYMSITKRKPSARTTITSISSDKLSETVNHLIALGFSSIHTETAHGSNGSGFIESEEDQLKIMRQNESIADLLLKKMENKEYFGYHNIIRNIRTINTNGGKIFPCGAGRGYLCIALNGDIYPCHRFVGNNKFLMGNVVEKTYDDFWEKKIHKEMQVMNRKECSACWARFICSGDCFAVNEEYNGDITKAHKFRCEMNKQLIELSLMIYSLIKRENKKEIEDLYGIGKQNKTPAMENENKNLNVSLA